MNYTGSNSNKPTPKADERRAKEQKNLYAYFYAQWERNRTGYRLEKKVKGAPLYNRVTGEDDIEWTLVISYKNNQDARQRCQADYRWLSSRNPKEEYRIVRVEYQ